jgi:hypothetical protein
MPLPKEEATPPVKKIYFVSVILFYFLNFKPQSYKKDRWNWSVKLYCEKKILFLSA